MPLPGNDMAKCIPTECGLCSFQTRKACSTYRGSHQQPRPHTETECPEYPAWGHKICLTWHQDGLPVPVWPCSGLVSDGWGRREREREKEEKRRRKWVLAGAKYHSCSIVQETKWLDWMCRGSGYCDLTGPWGYQTSLITTTITLHVWAKLGELAHSWHGRKKMPFLRPRQEWT